MKKRLRFVLPLITFVLVLVIVSVFGNDVFADDEGEEVSTFVHVTPDNFEDYFDESGTVKCLDTSEIQFSGEFDSEELGISFITINEPYKITVDEGDKAVFKNIFFIIGSDNVTIDGLDITVTNDVYAIMVYGCNKVTLNNNIISYTSLEGFDSYAIYACDCEDLTISGNDITYVGDLTLECDRKALLVKGTEEEGVTGIKVTGNTFDITIPSVDVDYDFDTWSPITRSVGIEFNNCVDVLFEDNDAKISADEQYTSYGYDSVYGIKYAGAAGADSYFTMNNNTIDVEGINQAYAVSIAYDIVAYEFDVVGTSITNNVIKVDSSYAYGIESSGCIYESTINNNTFNISGESFVYGIYYYQYMGAIEDTVIESNEFNLEAPACIGIEAVVCNSQIIKNTITGTGKCLMGMFLSFRDDGVCSENVIDVVDSYDENFQNPGLSGEIYKYNDTPITYGIYSKGSGDTIISDNVITTSGLGVVTETDNTVTGNTIETSFDYAVDVRKSSSTVTGNYLYAKDYLGDAAVTFTDTSEEDEPAEPVITGNYPIDLTDGGRIELSDTEFDYTGEEICPEVTVYYKDKKLSSSNYNVTYKDNIEVGTATVEVLYADSEVYYGILTKTFEIKEKTVEPTPTPTASVEPTATPAATSSPEATPTPDIKPQVETIKVSVPEGKKLVYNGKEQTGVDAADEYTVTGNTGTDVGTYSAVLTLKDKTLYTWNDGTTEDKTVTWTIEKAANSFKLKTKSYKVTLKNLDKSKKTIKVKKKIKLTNKGEGKYTYKLSSVSKKNYKKYFKINSKNGKITVKKGLPKGKYTVKIKVKAAGDSNHKESSYKKITIKVTVK
ncbi:MAG: hypothetical protein J5517_01735 [Eubacterium sp.]|nr:hypothetical protein [Eubacterium sp.]